MNGLNCLRIEESAVDDFVCIGSPRMPQEHFAAPEDDWEEYEIIDPKTGKQVPNEGFAATA